MNINYELIVVLATGAFIIGYIVIHELRIKKYLDSIKVGDTFELDLVKDLQEDPFDSNPLINLKEYQCVITDIKKNTKGETWVKYKNLADEKEKSEEIYTFAEHRHQIKFTHSLNTDIKFDKFDKYKI